MAPGRRHREDSVSHIEEITLLRDAPSPDYHGREWVWGYDAEGLTVRLVAARRSAIRLTRSTPLRAGPT
jgi:hypothetical protein